jgi:hypothetical protein
LNSSPPSRQPRRKGSQGASSVNPTRRAFSACRPAGRRRGRALVVSVTRVLSPDFGCGCAALIHFHIFPDIST